ncbi:hypothetical protein Trydic_g14423 [Trypoxylus dichotomus]
MIDVENISCMTYEEAVTGQNRHEWLQAIEEEKKFLIENNTCEEVDRQEAEEAKILNNKWVLRIKNDGRYKARLVVCGNQQECGIDFTETYSPVVDVSFLRIILAVAAARNYAIFGFDIKTAFLYGELEETIFMNIPKGYPHADKICKLKKSLYGLKQISLKWNELFTSFLRNNGLKALETQRCIFKNDDGTLILAIYVDDGILIGNNVNQMNEHNKIVDDEHDELRFPYREVVGSLLYASCKTRPDLAYAVNYESRFVENPKKLDVTNVKRTLRYLNGSTSGGIKYVSGADTELLEAFCDSDFAGCEDTRRSTYIRICYYVLWWSNSVVLKTSINSFIVEHRSRIHSGGRMCQGVNVLEMFDK